MTPTNSQGDNTNLCEKKLSVLQEISNFLIATDNITSIANLMLDLAINYSTAEKGSLMILNEGGELYIRAAKGIEAQLFSTFRQKIGEGIAGTVARLRIPVLVNDITTDKRFKKMKRDRYKTNTFISCPILYQDRLLGVLNINDKRDGSSFTQDEFTLITTISQQAAIVIQNSFLINQLKVKAAGLEEINKKLLDFDVVRTEFLTRVSHELRTPLNSIKGSIYYLSKTLDSDSAELKDFCEIISNETTYLISLAENLLDFLRLENETKTMKKSAINLPALLQEVLSSINVRAALDQNGLQIHINVIREISPILGDTIRVFQFFMNIIEGLSYYLEKDDIITVTLDENDHVNIDISTPRRLPESIYQDIWNSTYIFQGEHSEERLKLYLAWKVAETHKWKLLAENRQDGFHITVVIPNSHEERVEEVLKTTMDMFTEFLSELLDINICSIMLADELTGELSIKSAKGLSPEIISRTRISATDSVSGWVAVEGKPLLLEDMDTAPHFLKQKTKQYSTNSLLSLPLKIDDKVIGVLNLNNKRTGESFTKQDLDLASSLSERISFFLNRLYAGEYSEDYYRQFITSFDSLLNAEKKYPKKQRMFPTIMEKIISLLDVSNEEKKTAIYISVIYDLGIVIAEKDLSKGKKLSPSELSLVRIHPYNTVGLLDEFEFSEDVKKGILHHHERYDGKGYPDKLKGEEIPFLSRALSVVDSYCALITEKPYRKAYSKGAALSEIKKGSGTAYDPKIVEALEKAVQDFIMPGM